MTPPSLKPLKDLFNDLVDRRLWPVALALVVAIVAVPILLSSKSSGPGASSPAAASIPPAAPASSPDRAIADTSVIATTASGRGLAASKAENPFVQRGPHAKPPTSASAPGPGVATASSSGGSSSGTSSPGGSSPSSGSTAPVTSSPTYGPTRATKSPNKTPDYETASVLVRFGRVEDNRNLRYVARLSPLPNADNPVLISLGVAKGTHTAVFLVSSDTHAEGDGRCRPSPASCQTVWIKQGQTEFFDVTADDGTVTQYQLDLVRVRYGRTRSKRAAAASFLKSTSKRSRLSKLAERDKVASGRHSDAAGRLPVFSDLVWSASLGGVIGIPSAGKDDSGAAPPRPVVVPASELPDVSLRPSAPAR